MQKRHTPDGTRTFPFLLAAAGAAVLAGEARAEDLRVPRQYPTIEAAQKVAVPGDRIVVARGRHRGVTVHAHGVTVVGRGSARLEGETYVRGPGAAIEGFRVRGTVSLVSEGNRAEGLRLQRGAAILAGGGLGAGAEIRGNQAQGAAAIRVTADGATIEDNRIDRGSIVVQGHGATLEGNAAESVSVFGTAPVVRANDIGAGGLEVVGDGAVVQGNDVPEGMIYLSGTDSELLSNTSRGAWVADADGLLVQGNTLGEGGLELAGDGAVVQGNVVRRDHRFHETAAIAAFGDGTRVVDNDVETGVTAIRTWGADVEVAGNRVVTYGFSQHPSIAADLDGGVALIEGNDVRHYGSAGILVDGDGGTVAANVVFAPSGGPGNGIRVVGDGALVTGNECRAAEGIGGDACGIVIDGSTSLVTENVVTGTAANGIEIWRGTGNVVSDCVITDVGACGIWIQDQATASVVTSVTSQASLFGFVNLAERTELSDSTLTGNRLTDVLTATTLVNFTGCTFDTFSTDVELIPWDDTFHRY